MVYPLSVMDCFNPEQKIKTKEKEHEHIVPEVL